MPVTAENLLAQVGHHGEQLRELLARFEEMQSREFQERNETNEIYIPPGERLGDKVIEFNGVSKGYGDRVLIDDLTFSVPKGAIVGIIGGCRVCSSSTYVVIMCCSPSTAAHPAPALSAR